MSDKEITITGQPFDIGAQAISMKMESTIDSIVAGHPLGVLDEFLQGALSGLLAYHSLHLGTGATALLAERLLKAARANAANPVLPGEARTH